MLDLLTTDAFASWFSSLPSAPAEDVAATLEVIVQLGTRTEAPGSSEWLLWYEHPSLGQRPPTFTSPEHSPAFVRFTQEWGRFNGYVRRVVRHLESEAFGARLASLSPSAAAEVHAAVKRLRRLATTRALDVSERVGKRLLRPGGGDAEALARFSDVSSIRQAYLAALAAAGFEVQDVPACSPALREITLRSTAPGLRLLYGLDEPKGRGLVVVGEWLDRTFYGDTVRHAEGVWRQFLEGRSLATAAAGAR